MGEAPLTAKQVAVRKEAVAKLARPQRPRAAWQFFAEELIQQVRVAVGVWVQQQASAGKQHGGRTARTGGPRKPPVADRWAV